MKTLNTYMPVQRRVITGIGPTPLSVHRVIANTKQQLAASHMYVENQKRDGVFKIDDQTFCIIENECSSFWELSPVTQEVKA